MGAYFGEDFFPFFYELSLNNSKDWFDQNRKRYTKVVKEPFYAFTQDLINVIKEHDPDLNIQVKHAVFRINRDIRFAKDKSPYNKHISAFMSPKGKKDGGYAGFYFHFGLEGSYIGGGAYSPSKDQLQKIRTGIAQDPETFMKHLNNAKFKKKYKELKGAKNKRIPKEFNEVAEQYPVLYNKQFYYMAESEDNDWALRPDLLEFCMDHYKAQKDVERYLRSLVS